MFDTFVVSPFKVELGTIVVIIYHSFHVVMHILSIVSMQSINCKYHAVEFLHMDIHDRSRAPRRLIHFKYLTIYSLLLSFWTWMLIYFASWLVENHSGNTILTNILILTSACIFTKYKILSHQIYSHTNTINALVCMIYMNIQGV